MPEYTMADFRAEMHRRKHGEQYGPRPRPTPTPTKPRSPRESWPEFVAAVVAGCRRRLAQLETYSPVDVIPCPWAAHFGHCTEPCRCDGTRKVTVGLMRAHYRLVLVRYGGKR